MGSSLALLVFAVGVSGLFFLDHDKSQRTSKFLWLPVVWLGINASRPISTWFGLGYEAAGQPSSSGSVMDQIVSGLLILVGIIGIVRRRKITLPVLRASWPIVLYFALCLF